MSETARIIELRQRLLAVLRDIEAHAKASAPQRCPYRASDDVCTFGYGCRNKTADRCTR